MSDRAAAVAYLMSPPDSFWVWRDDGRDVAWTSGETIAFRPEVQAVIDRLAPTCLPPFSAIVLLLAATRDNWSTTSRQLAAHAEKLSLPGGGDPTSAVGVTLRAIGHRLGSDTEHLINSLNAVAALPADLRHPLGAKTVLAEMAFEKAESAVTPEISGQIVAELRSAADPATFDLGRPNGTALRDLITTIDALKYSQVDAETLRLRVRTGLEQQITSPPEDLGPAKRVHHLLGEMADDPELGGLSRLARRLLAAVQVPRSLHRHEEMLSGGVADITNRGQLDRLLISELASDDLTLAVRVAVNEALYLQRESPPHQPPKRRVLLIDSGIRTWGVPRVFITAVALALAATGDELGELATFRPDGSAIIPIDLTTREGLLSHLEFLEPRPHFGASLPAFTEEALKDSEQAEAFLITQEDVLDDPEFRTALRQQNKLIAYAATVGRDGRFNLWSLTPAGRSLVREAVLDLDQILEPPKKRPLLPPTPLMEPTGNLPVILSLEHFPLLLPPGTGIRRMVMNNMGDKVAITRDRRLLSWRDDAAAATLYDKLPTGRLDLFRFAFEGEAVVAVLAAQRAGGTSCIAVMVDKHTGDNDISELSGITTPPLGMTLREDVLYVIGRNRAWAYNLGSAEPIATLDTFGYRWDRGRVFYRRSMQHLLCLTGAGLGFEFVDVARPGVVFEVADKLGPLCMTRMGEIQTVSAEPQVVCPGLNIPVIFEGVSADGTAIVARSMDRKPAGNEERYFLDFSTDSKWRETHHPAHTLLNCNSQQQISFGQRYQLRTRFEGVLVDDVGLLLYTDSGKLLAIGRVGSNLELVDPGFRIGPTDARLRHFGRIASPKGTGYRLEAATWENIPQVFLDSRGLLHLKSKHRSIPEITLVLTNEGPLAGWSSDGKVYGPDYFHGSRTSHHVGHLEDLIRRFTEHLR